MSSLIVSHDSHLMMLEVAVENLYVPWTTEFDKVILKKTTVMFRMLDEEWTSLAPNRLDRRPYSGSSCENENFHGGTSVVFCVPAGFFEKKAIDVDIQLYVRKEVCKYFEMDSCQTVGFATVPVNDLLNGIAKQMRERNELSEHLSDSFKQQIISRSTTGTYNLLDENFRKTTSTISLYIRISSLGKCLVTEITRLESDIRGVFSARREPDEEQYLTRQLTADELQSGRCKVEDFPRVPCERLVCRCEELIKKKNAAANLSDITMTSVEARDVAAIARMNKNNENIDVRAGERVGNITTRNSPKIANIRAAIGDANVSAREGYVANTPARNNFKNIRTIGDIEDADVGSTEGNTTDANTIARDGNTKSAKERINVKDAAARKRNTLRRTNTGDIEDADVDSTEGNTTDANTIARDGNTKSAKERINVKDAAARKRNTLRRTNTDARRHDNERAKPKTVENANKGQQSRTRTKENEKANFQSLFFVSNTLKFEKNRTTIGNAKEEMTHLCAPGSACPLLQTYSLYSKLRPHLTCFSAPGNVSSRDNEMNSPLSFINCV